MTFRARLCGLALAGAALGCAPAPPPCVHATVPDCSGTPAPDFTTLHTTVFAARCVVGNACHSLFEHEGGLVLEGRDRAFEDLSTRVVPGDAACSELAFRVTTPSLTQRMPPAGNLSTAEICQIIAWIEAGAAP